eukprot:scaffold68710_cov69-Phaeocystis_antarctica.AAC.3
MALFSVKTHTHVRTWSACAGNLSPSGSLYITHHPRLLRACLPKLVSARSWPENARQPPRLARMLLRAAMAGLARAAPLPAAAAARAEAHP